MKYYTGISVSTQQHCLVVDTGVVWRFGYTSINNKDIDSCFKRLIACEFGTTFYHIDALDERLRKYGLHFDMLIECTMKEPEPLPKSLFSDYDDIQTYRFFCDCGSAQHVLEITVDEDQQLSFDYYHGRCTFTLWERIKVAFGVLFQNYMRPWSDFVVREEDKDEIIELLRKSNVKRKD